MAIVQLGWRLSVNLMDNSGSQVNRRYEAPVASFADDLEFRTAAALLITRLSALTECEISGYQLESVWVENALVLPASGVENENQAFFSGKINGDPTDSGTQSIPGADPDIFTTLSGPGANVVNMANTSVQDWLTLFDGDPAVIWTISDGETFDAPTVTGKRRHTKNSNG